MNEKILKKLNQLVEIYMPRYHKERKEMHEMLNEIEKNEEEMQQEILKSIDDARRRYLTKYPNDAEAGLAFSCAYSAAEEAIKKFK